MSSKSFQNASTLNELAAMDSYFRATSTVAAFGDNNNLNFPRTGIQIGGGNVDDGSTGVVAFADGYSGWTTLQPSQYPSTAELAVQPSSIAGTCTIVSGGNTVTKTGGGDFIPQIVGKRIYIGVGQIYLVDSYISASQVVVKNLNGSSVSFGSSGTFTFVVAYVNGSGTCNTNGTTVTRVSGDPFIPLTNTEYLIKINGATHTVSAFVSPNEITLASSAGTQSNASYEFWTSVDNISSAFRVHRISGAGFEENVTLGAYADGYFHLQAAGGVGRQYPFFIGSGYETGGSKRKQITMDGTAGYVALGGNYDKFTLEVEYTESASNWTYFRAGTAGSSGPRITAKGPDTSIDLNFSPKGIGALNFWGSDFFKKQFEITYTNGESWLGVTADNFGQPRLYAAGAAANIDIQLVTKGTGRVLVGPWTAGGAAVNGYIEVKDSAGNLRKVATIA